MKKILVVVIAVLALVSCDKTIEVNNIECKEGRKVTLTCGVPQTKVASTGSADGVSFTWEDTDKLVVTAGDSESTLDYVSGAGTATATFSGTMPEGFQQGDKFDVKVKCEAATSSQTYVEGGLPKNLMLLQAKDCTLGSTITLQPAYAAICLNLYGNSVTVGKIIVTRKQGDNTVDTYTLTCTGGKTLSADPANPTTFYVIIPGVDSNSYSFDVEIYDNAAAPIKSTKFTSSSQTFVAGQVVMMPAKNTYWTKFTVKNASELTSVVGEFSSDSKPSDSYEIILKEGTYSVGDLTVLETNQKQITIRGEGKVSLSYTGSNNRIFQINGHGTYAVNESITFKNLSFDNLGTDGYAVLYSSSNGITHVHDITFEQCTFTSGYADVYTGKSSAASGTTFSNCTQTSGRLYAGYGVDGDAGYVVKADGCTFSGTSFINAQNNGKVIISSCNVTSNNDYTVRTNGGDITVTNSTFNSLYAATSDCGFLVVRASDAKVTVDNNTAFLKESTYVHDVYSINTTVTVVKNGSTVTTLSGNGYYDFE